VKKNQVKKITLRQRDGITILRLQIFCLNLKTRVQELEDRIQRLEVQEV
jgi:hypothetical protein